MNERIHAHLTRIEGYKYRVTFDELPGAEVVMDEPPPLGKGEGPTAAMMLSSAIGHCLTASLMFCLDKSRAKAEDIRTDVDVALVRNERGRWRVGEIKVKMKPKVGQSDREKLARCRELFEDFCIVTASVREGVDVEVDVDIG
ncbi:MAG: OsmC family protein [Thermoplasmata archaeon]